MYVLPVIAVSAIDLHTVSSQTRILYICTFAMYQLHMGLIKCTLPSKAGTQKVFQRHEYCFSVQFVSKVRTLLDIIAVHLSLVFHT
jgi:hypothetical protein